METKIIVINKDIAFVKELKHSLEQEDYSVETAYTIKEAVGKIKNDGFELVILDLILPDGNGLSLCRTIRKHSQVPIIIVSEKKEDSSKIRFYNFWCW